MKVGVLFSGEPFLERKLRERTNFFMSINLKPNSLEFGRNFTVLSFGSSRKTSAFQTTHFSVWWHIVFLMLIMHRTSLLEKLFII
jgi:hypothetical protein